MEMRVPDDLIWGNAYSMFYKSPHSIQNGKEQATFTLTLAWMTKWKGKYTIFIDSCNYIALQTLRPILVLIYREHPSFFLCYGSSIPCRLWWTKGSVIRDCLILTSASGAWLLVPSTTILFLPRLPEVNSLVTASLQVETLSIDIPRIRRTKSKCAFALVLMGKERARVFHCPVLRLMSHC